MPSLTEVRDAAVTQLQAVFPTLPRVEAFSGEITLDAVAEKGLPPGVSVLIAAVAAAVLAVISLILAITSRGGGDYDDEDDFDDSFEDDYADDY